MDASLLQPLIPIVAIVCGVGLIPAIVFIVRYFRFKERELQLEADAQRWAEKNYTALEMRLQRLESLLLAVDPQRFHELAPPQQQPDMQALPPGAKLRGQ